MQMPSYRNLSTLPIRQLWYKFRPTAIKAGRYSYPNQRHNHGDARFQSSVGPGHHPRSCFSASPFTRSLASKKTFELSEKFVPSSGPKEPHSYIISLHDDIVKDNHLDWLAHNLPNAEVTHNYDSSFINGYAGSTNLFCVIQSAH